MTEYLYNLLAFHHFLDVTIYNTKILLLLHEILTTKTSKILTCKKHNTYHEQSYKSKRDIQNDHTYQHTDNGDHTGNQLRDTLTDHLTQGINVIGINGHDVSMRMCIKIFDRQSLHTLKHFISKITQGSLTHVNHQTIVCIGTCHTYGIKTGHPEDCHCQRMEIRSFCFQKRHDILINKCLHKHGSLHIRKNTDYNSDHNYNNVDPVIFINISHQSSKHFTRILNH